MPVEVFLETWEVECDSVETVAFRAGEPAPYPHLSLRRTGQSSKVALRTVILANALTRVVVCLDLGGRIIGIEDLRSGTSVLAVPERVSLFETGPRGLEWPHGIQLTMGAESRPNALGPVDYQVREDLGAVLMHELVVGTTLSWTASLSLREDHSSLLYEVRGFNRSLMPCAAPRGLLVGPAWDVFQGSPGTVGYYDPDRDSGCILSFPEGSLRGRTQGDVLTLVRSESPMLPRFVDSWAVSIEPYSGLGRPLFVQPGLVAGANGPLRISASLPMPGSRLFVQSPDGATLEAETDLHPATPFIAELGFVPKGLAVGGPESSQRPSNGVRGLDRYEARADLLASECLSASQGHRRGSLEDGFFSSLRGGAEVVHRPQALSSAFNAARAFAEARKGDFQSALELVDAALMTNGEDHLAWWLKVACSRKLQSGPEDDALLNAHFLAPLEPLLKAESILAGLQREGLLSENLLGSLAQDPDTMLEVLGLYLEAGQYKDVATIVEATPPRDRVPMVEYVLAYAHLQSSGFAAEAATRVASVATLPLAPPFPWRAMEIKLVRDLALRFPKDQRLSGLVSLMDALMPSA